MTEPVGGLRDRLISESFYRMIESALDELGWFNTNPDFLKHTPNIRWGPVPDDEQIDFNTVVVTFENIDDDDAELGSNATDVTHQVYVDFYGEDESVGQHVSGDIRAILAGQMPDIGRDRRVLEVLDWTMATPARVFTCSIERLERTKIHREDQPWQRFWYTVFCELEEFRP